MRLRAGLIYISIAALLLLTLSSTIPPKVTAQTGSELIVNGSFEEGEKGWLFEAGSVVTTYRKHGGSFAGRVGTSNGLGTIRQSVNIPDRSTATLSFWYLALQGDAEQTSLIASLLDAAGRRVASWTAMSDGEWHQVTFDIGSTLAGRSVTILFEGRGDIRYEFYYRVICPGRCPPDEPIVIEKVRLYYVYAYVDEVSIVVKPFLQPEFEKTLAFLGLITIVPFRKQDDFDAGLA